MNFKSYILIITSVIFLHGFAISQAKLEWDKLAQVDYSFEHSEEFKAYYTRMVPSDEIKDLNGKEVEITGFILPVSTDGEQYFLSAFPFSSCFFCGGAGPESVIELRLTNQGKRYEVDQVLTFTGKFIFNDIPFEMNYILENAQMVSAE